MSTWHQRKGGALAGIYAPDPVFWNVVCDAPNEMASIMQFTTEAKAEAYASIFRYGKTVVPPQNHES